MKHMLHHKGFTLVEILVVVLIGIAAALVAVPVFQHSQAKNRYLAASGVLMDLGNAITLVQEQYPDLLLDPTQITGNGGDVTSEAADLAPTSTNLMGWLRANKYIQNIPFEGSTGTYRGYTFWVKTVTSTDENLFQETCCAPSIDQTHVMTESVGKPIVACMTGENINSEYTCAWVDKFGNVTHNKERS